MASRKTAGSGGRRRSTSSEQPASGPSELILYTTSDRQTREDRSAQLISERADATKPNMGLTTWKNAPVGPIRKADAEVAKNYLTEEELRALNLLVDQYLSFAEFQAQQRKPMTMAAWAAKLDAFLTLNDRDILGDAGRISHKVAVGVAGREFEKYEREQRRIAAASVTDFDKAVDRIKKLNS